MRWWQAGALVLVVGWVAGGCAQVEQANNVTNKVSACTEAIGLADLNPLVDPERLRARADDKAARLRELGNNVEEQDLRRALFTMADSYVQVQQERFDDLAVVTNWAKRNAEHLARLREICF